MESEEDDEYFTADEEDVEEEEEEADIFEEFGFCVWVSRDGTQWYLPRNSSLSEVELQF